MCIMSVRVHATSIFMSMSMALPIIFLKFVTLSHIVSSHVISCYLISSYLILFCHILCYPKCLSVCLSVCLSYTTLSCILLYPILSYPTLQCGIPSYPALYLCISRLIYRSSDLSSIDPSVHLSIYLFIYPYIYIYLSNNYQISLGQIIPQTVFYSQDAIKGRSFGAPTRGTSASWLCMWRQLLGGTVRPAPKTHFCLTCSGHIRSQGIFVVTLYYAYIYIYVHICRHLYVWIDMQTCLYM